MSRVIVEIVRELSGEVGFNLESYSDEWILKLVRGEKIRWIVGFQFDLNGGASSRLVSDKAGLALALSASGVPIVPHQLLFSNAIGKNFSLDNFLFKDFPLVVKPNEGTGGKDVVLVKKRSQLKKALDDLAQRYRTIAITPYVDVLHEFRVIQLNSEPLVVYEKCVDSSAGEWRHNLGLGAVPVLVERADVQALAIQAAQALPSLRFCAVDVIEDKQGNLQVLEINSGVMMERFAETHPNGRHIAKQVYARAVGLMLRD